ncbi:MAG: ATP-binding protein [Leucobacter sp.]
MSLYESGHSTGEVSLADLLAGAVPNATPATLTVTDLIERTVIGGWPETLGWSERDARRWMQHYVDNIAEVDIPALGPRRNPGNIRRLLASMSRAVGTPLNRSALEREVGGDNGPVSSETLNHYLTALSRLMLVEALPAWRPHMRSRTQLRTSAVHHFVDPAIGAAALRVGSNELLKDLEAAGFHFESLVVRDLRVYSQMLGASLSSWRNTKSNKEVDVIIELPDGTWAAVEIKLGEGATDAAAESLLHFASKVDIEKQGKPTALIVINGGRFSYRRPDGVAVVPISVLGP